MEIYGNLGHGSIVFKSRCSQRSGLMCWCGSIELMEGKPAFFACTVRQGLKQ